MLFSRGFSLSDHAQSVERLGVEAIPARERRPKPALHAVEQTAAHEPLPAAPPPPAATIYVPQKPTAAELILANLKAISLILSARALLLLSLLGGFVLALGAMAWQTPMGLYVLIAWSVLTVLPMTGLEVTGRLRWSPPAAPEPPGG
jgi:hypothetical protein